MTQEIHPTPHAERDDGHPARAARAWLAPKLTVLGELDSHTDAATGASSDNDGSTSQVTS